MKFSKRYTIMNFYVRGSNQVPQYGHGLNNLWKKAWAKEFSKEANDLFVDWAFKGETEVFLQGGDDEAMEKLFAELDAIKHLPSAKFNEPGLRGTCTVVTFVADERIVSGNNYVRNNRLTPANVVESLKDVLVDHVDAYKEPFVLTDDEIAVISKIAFMPLAS